MKHPRFLRPIPHAWLIIAGLSIIGCSQSAPPADEETQAAAQALNMSDGIEVSADQVLIIKPSDLALDPQQLPGDPLKSCGVGKCDPSGVFCDACQCYPPDAAISQIMCKCPETYLADPMCGIGVCAGQSYCDGPTCAAPQCYAPNDAISLAMCGGEPVSCDPPIIPFPDALAGLAACGLLDPACGLGECVGASYCDGPTCAAPQCYAPNDMISLAMCGGGPVTCDPTATIIPTLDDLTDLIACGLVDPACGLGECVGESYCTGLGCAGGVCYAPSYIVSQVMCGGATLSAACMSVYACTTPPPGMVAWWTFDEASGAISKDIIGGNHGTQHGGAAPTTGQVVNALSFDGVDDGVVAPRRPWIQHDFEEITVDAWILPSSLPYSWNPIVNYIDHEFQPSAPGVPATSTEIDDYLFFVDSGGELGFMRCDDTVCDLDVTSGAGVWPGSWTHVAVTASTWSNQITFYVNGSAVMTGTYGALSGSPLNGNLWEIGQTTTYSASFDGAIDEVEIFNRPLGASEIAAIYGAHDGGKCKAQPVVMNPANGELLSGTTRTVTIDGFAPDPSATVDIQRLDPASNTWSSIGTTTTGTVPTGAWSSSAPFYPFAFTISEAVSAIWPDGGIGRVRAQITAGGVTTTAATLDDAGCPASMSSTPLEQIIDLCRSIDSPVLSLVDTDPVATPPSPFLSRYASGGGTEPGDYYATIDASSFDARFTFAGWKGVNGFPSSDETTAIYFNEGDLGFGREMHCRTVKACDGTAGLCTGYVGGGGCVSTPCSLPLRTACYVTNYGAVGGTAAVALSGAIAGSGAVATVAMEYLITTPTTASCCLPTSPASTVNLVRFYVYDGSGNRSDVAVLDSEGAKDVPGVCLSCHGGSYDSTTHTSSDAHFLPFDVYSFAYSSASAYTLSAQQEAFRKLNVHVLDTNPGTGITDLIHGMYSGNEYTAGTVPISTYVPAGYQQWAGQERVYNEIVRPLCRTCHLSREFKNGFLTFGDLSVSPAQGALCSVFDMPHAEVPFQNLWGASRRVDFVNSLGPSTLTSCP